MKLTFMTEDEMCLSFAEGDDVAYPDGVSADMNVVIGPRTGYDEHLNTTVSQPDTLAWLKYRQLQSIAWGLQSKNYFYHLNVDRLTVV